MTSPDWGDLRIVLAAARAGGIAAAARRLGVSESTVVRHLARVEGGLDARLFERGPAGLATTPAGEAAVACAEQMERQVQAMHAAVAGADQRAAGCVRITTVPLVVNHLLVPALPALLASQPALEVELVAEPRDLSLTRREADIAVRFARPVREAAVITRRIGRLDFAVYARTDRDPDRLPWLGYVPDMAALAQARWIEDRCRGDDAAGVRVRLNDVQGVLAGVRAGIGKSLLPVAVAGADDRLVRVDAGPAPVSRDLWLLVHPELRDLARVRVAIAWLEDAIGAA